jgi:hypothetical protein
MKSKRLIIGIVVGVVTLCVVAYLVVPWNIDGSSFFQVSSAS